MVHKACHRMTSILKERDTVEGPVLDWGGYASEAVHETAGVVPVDPGCGGVSNGDPLGVHSVLYDPMTVSTTALL